MLINLLSNAVKFTERGRVTVRASSRAGAAPDRHVVAIAVEDTGPGIEPRDLARIFDAFDQADSRVRIGGTGLGLAISRSFARLMHGDLVVESTPGKGSVFTFSFEAGAASSDAIPAVVAQPVPTGLDPDQPDWKLLIVDDVQTNRDLLDELLSRIGFPRASRRAARRPSRSRDEWHPDLVLMDVRMPGMGGLEAVRRLRKGGSKAAIIAITASSLAEAEARDSCCRHGCVRAEAVPGRGAVRDHRRAAGCSLRLWTDRAAVRPLAPTRAPSWDRRCRSD